MEYLEKNWINGHGVSICEGINEVEHTSLGGELIIHGGLSIQNIYSTVTTISSDSIQIIDKRKIYEESINPRYRILDNVQVGFDFNQHPNIRYGYPISLIDFFNKNNVKNFNEVTPDIIVRWPNSKWNWSKEKIKIILEHKPISLTWTGNEKSIHFYNKEYIDINTKIDESGNHIEYSFRTYTPKRWRNKFMYDREIASAIEHGSVLSKYHNKYVKTQPFSCEWLKNRAIDELDEGFLSLSCEETKELLRYNGIEKVENITLSLVVNHPKFTTIERKFLDLLY